MSRTKKQLLSAVVLIAIATLAAWAVRSRNRGVASEWISTTREAPPASHVQLQGQTSLLEDPTSRPPMPSAEGSGSLQEVMIREPEPNGSAGNNGPSKDPAIDLVRELDSFRETPNLLNGHLVTIRSVKWIMDFEGSFIDMAGIADDVDTDSEFMTHGANEAFVPMRTTAFEGDRLYRVYESEFPAFHKVHKLNFKMVPNEEVLDSDLQVEIEQLALRAMEARRK